MTSSERQAIETIRDFIKGSPRQRMQRYDAVAALDLLTAALDRAEQAEPFPWAAEFYDWVDRCFPDREPLDAQLVLGEEGAELAAACSRAIVKKRQGIRADEDLDAKVWAELADVVISGLDYCRAHGLDFFAVVADRWGETVGKRDWAALASGGEETG